eukprot:SAG22_NODE_3445_length_1707_cov_1.128731_3_plen_102_part_00
MARAKAQAKDAQASKGGGGKEGMASRSGADMAVKMDATAARKAQVEQNKKDKAAKLALDEARYQREKKKAERVRRGRLRTLSPSLPRACAPPLSAPTAEHP